MKSNILKIRYFLQNALLWDSTVQYNAHFCNSVLRQQGFMLPKRNTSERKVNTHEVRAGRSHATLLVLLYVHTPHPLNILQTHRNRTHRRAHHSLSTAAHCTTAARHRHNTLAVHCPHDDCLTQHKQHSVNRRTPPLRRGTGRIEASGSR